MDISIIIPTLNAETGLDRLLFDISNSNLGKLEYEVIILDSQSEDNTQVIAKKYGCKIFEIDRKNFNHGGTRNFGAKCATGDYLLYLTQDVLLFDNESIMKLVNAFEEPSIAIAYGRQISHTNSGVLGAFARTFNYGEFSEIRSYADKVEKGIKTVFNSNSFSMYRKSIFENLGGFPDDVILGEDMYLAAKALLNNYKIAYAAESLVHHSHDYRIIQELKRNFDIGVFHEKEKWILESFSSAEGEGLKYVLDEQKYLISKRKYHLLPYAIMKNASKLLGYKIGRNYARIPFYIVKRLSMYKSYWISKG